MTPPDTGASMSSWPRAASSAASARVPTGEDELMSIKTEPGASPAATPRSPSSTSRTMSPFGSTVITTPAAAPSALGPAGASASVMSRKRAIASGAASSTCSR